MLRVDRVDQVIGASRELFKLTVDMETGLRGFLLTGRPLFLQPYREADSIMEARYGALEQLLSGNASEQAQVARIHTSFLSWRRLAEQVIQRGGIGLAEDSQERRLAEMLDRKAAMDAIRAQYDLLLAREMRERDRSLQSAESLSVALSACCLLCAVFGARSLWLTLKGQLTELSEALENQMEAERVANGLALQIARRDKEEAIANYRGQVEAIDRSQIVIEFGYDGLIQKINENHTRALGYSAAELEGREFSLLVPEAERASAAYQDFWAALRRGQAQPGEFERVRKDGRSVWVDAYYNPVFDAAGTPVKIIGLLSDITERLRIQQELRNTEARLKVILDSIQVGVILIDDGGNVLSANPAAALMFEYGPQAIVRQNMRELVPEPLQACAGSGRRFPIELTITEASLNGERRFIWLIRDITERRRAEQERLLQEEGLRKSQAFLEQTGELAGVGGWEVDLRTNELTWAAETYRILGADPSYKPVLSEAINLYTPESRPIITAVIERAAAGGGGWDEELSLRGHHGRLIWARVVGTAEIVDGKPVRLTGAFQDITARVAERQALQDANRRAKLATESSGIGIWDWDLPADQFLCDAGVYRLFGLGAEDSSLAGLEFWLQRVYPADQAACEQALRAAIEGIQPFDAEFRIVLPDGSLRHLRAAAQVSRDHAGKALRMVGTIFDITERKVQLEALRESRALLAQTGRLAGVGGWQLDLATNKVTWAPETYRLFADEVEYIPELERAVSEYSPESQLLLSAAIERARSEGQGWDLELSLNRPDGRLMWARMIGTVEFTGDRPTRVLGAFQDITARVAEKQALQDANTRAALATDSGGIGIWEWDVTANRIVCNARMYLLCNLEPHPDAAHPAEFWERFVHPEDMPRVAQALQAGMDGVKPYNTEYRIVWDDGSLHWIRASGQCARDQHGKVVRMLGTNVDITERKLQMEALRKSEFFLERTGRMAGIGGWELDLTTQEIYWSREAYRIHGVDPGTFRPDFATGAQFFPPEDRPAVLGALQRCISDGTGWDLDVGLDRADGQRITVRLVGSAEFVEGRPVRLVGTIQDITSRVAEQQALREANTRAALATESGGIGIWDWDCQTNQIACDSWMYRLYNLGPGVAGRFDFEFLSARLHPEDRADVLQALQDGVAGIRPFDAEYRILWDDGSVHWIKASGKVTGYRDGRALHMVGTNFEITARKEAEELLRQSNEKEQMLLRGVTDYAILMLDPAGHVVTWNEGAEKIKGYQAKEILGRHFSIFYAPESIVDSRPWQAIEIAKTEGRFQEEGLRVRKDGSLFWANVVITALHDRRGQLRGFGKVTCDITARRQAEQAALEARLEAEVANRAKSDFLANMSHEVRTPVNAILGMTHLALRANPSPQQLNYLTKIDRAAQSLLSIMNDILDFSKMEAGKLTIERITFSLDDVLKNLLDMVGQKAEQKRLPIVISIAPDVPRELTGDPLRLCQVLINLVGNAIKFADQGEITVAITMEDMLRFSVTDSGIGITHDQMSDLFQSFNQADTSTTRKYGGTGLGLAISKQLCELMGGTISVQSEFGRGSTFTFTAAVGIAVEGPGAPARNRARDHQSKRVLIVDDSENTGQEISRMLLIQGHDPLCVASGEEALSALVASCEAGHPFDLVLMDWRLPGLDGVEISRRIKAHPMLSPIPAILLISAFERDEVTSGVEETALDGFLVKPVSEAQLAQAISRIYREKPGVARIGSPRPNDEVSSLKGRRVLVVEDNEINRELATELLADLGVSVTSAVDGREGVDRVSSQPFDLVLMDIQMPVMDGLTATRQIRLDRRLKALPIIAMTAHAMSGDRQRSLDAGMNDHITKPISFDELTGTLLKWMPHPASSLPRHIEQRYPGTPAAS
jgi:PAS domain S-box-containing protein